MCLLCKFINFFVFKWVQWEIFWAERKFSKPNRIENALLSDKTCPFEWLAKRARHGFITIDRPGTETLAWGICSVSHYNYSPWLSRGFYESRKMYMYVWLLGGWNLLTWEYSALGIDWLYHNSNPRNFKK